MFLLYNRYLCRSSVRRIDSEISFRECVSCGKSECSQKQAKKRRRFREAPALNKRMVGGLHYHAAAVTARPVRLLEFAVPVPYSAERPLCEVPGACHHVRLSPAYEVPAEEVFPLCPG